MQSLSKSPVCLIYSKFKNTFYISTREKHIRLADILNIAYKRLVVKYSCDLRSNLVNQYCNKIVKNCVKSNDKNSGLTTARKIDNSTEIDFIKGCSSVPCRLPNKYTAMSADTVFNSQ